MSNEGTATTTNTWPDGAHLVTTVASLDPNNSSEPLIFSNSTVIVPTQGYAYWPSFFFDDADAGAVRAVWQNTDGAAMLGGVVG